ncbi:MAG: N-acetylneuraminate synthase family protein [Candidatus Zhuqueibacterota bacterium]
MNKLFDKLFIFEMANNHQGSVDHGIKIIREMGKITRKYGINGAVKFQYRDLDTFIHKDFIGSTEIKHIPRFLGTRLSPNEFAAMVQTVRDEGMVTVCTPFDENSVSLILDHGIDILKVASCSANDWSLLETISKTKKPVICSTGGLPLYKIDNVVSFFIHREVEFALLHCVGMYPTPVENIFANFLSRLIKRFPYITLGYSGHESPDETDIVKVMIAKGAKIFERHVGVETDTIKLNKYSMNPKQTEEWIKNAQKAFAICGESDNKKITQDEVESLRSLMRGVYAKQDIKAGEKLSPDKVYYALPCIENQTSTSEYLDTLMATRDYSADEAIMERRPFDKVMALREVIHDIKGMLYEANITVRKNFTIDLSHHYGIERIRQWGAVIVNMVNRTYCKKLIIVLPGQKHPTHTHKIKEETFQLLWGDIEILMNGEQRFTLKPGESLLVEPGIKHSFSSVGGAILEEISTTHIKGDSYYEDEEIAKKDLIERKTVIENW